jgi:hypothetical protein
VTTIHQESYHCHGASSHQLSCFENLPTTPSELYQEFANTYDIQCLVLHGDDNMYYWFGKACN